MLHGIEPTCTSNKAGLVAVEWVPRKPGPRGSDVGDLEVGVRELPPGRSARVAYMPSA